jgi:hypothetical protein
MVICEQFKSLNLNLKKWESNALMKQEVKMEKNEKKTHFAIRRNSLFSLLLFGFAFQRWFVEFKKVLS